jgi:hypothetical protein
MAVKLWPSRHVGNEGRCRRNPVHAEALYEGDGTLVGWVGVGVDGWVLQVHIGEGGASGFGAQAAGPILGRRPYINSTSRDSSMKRTPT